MSATLRVGFGIAIRQVESLDGLRVFSTIHSASGFRFIEETHVHEPAGPGYNDYWYWERTLESGKYATEQEAFEEGMKTLSWPQK